MPKLRTLMCTLLVGVFLVGCGGSSSSSSKADYKKKVLALTNTFRSQFTASQTKIQTTSDPNGKADAVDEVKTEYSNLANDLDKLKAPGGAQPAQDASVSALRKGVDDLGRLSDAARARDQAKARQVAAALTRDGADVTSKLQELGTKVGG